MQPTLSSVVVLVPAADRVLGRWRNRLTESASWGVGAHITVLYPFLAPEDLTGEVVARLAGAVASVPAFHLRLDAIGWFGDEVVYVAPRDARPFQMLTRAVSSAFDGLQSYGGQFGDVPTPHLTLGHGHPKPVLQAAADAVTPLLPIETDVSDVMLMTGAVARESWSVRTVLHLGPPR